MRTAAVIPGGWQGHGATCIVTALIREAEMRHGGRWRLLAMGCVALALAAAAQDDATRVDALPARPGADTEGRELPPMAELFDGFRLRATGVGYMTVPRFLDFLDTEPAGEAAGAGGLFARGALLGILGILVGGFLLNLTPCVLPMVPVNLAIIGAGARAGSRARGFLLGGAYGLAMAVVYGGLGLLVVLTGATFGTLNASPWFNAAIAALFVVLGLAMFDLIPIDFSRFQGRIGGAHSRGRLALAFGMGGVAALLAGACVAPVLISVLLLSADLYGRGAAIGLVLPFLLGIGMGLPWPFAGAGMAFLPKPGRWMTVVKVAFGVFILATAFYYGRLATRLAQVPAEPDAAAAPATPDGMEAFRLTATSTGADWRAVLDRSRAGGKPVFIDFWATWCRNCIMMERTTFRDEAVVERFRDFVVIKYQAEHPSASPSREILEHFEIIGLPTYVLLDPSG